MRRLGLIGKNISYSFSKEYFNLKFQKEAIQETTYSNFDIKDITLFPSIIKETKHLIGLNITIPYKELIIPYLDKLDKKAKKIGAVNTIKVSKQGKLIGYNTDYYGFLKALSPHLKEHHKKALILGTGGASKAIIYALKKMNIDYCIVSRSISKNASFTYNSLTENNIKSHQIIINCTPLGTSPNINECPNIPYTALSKNHILFDLIYNPEESLFLKKGMQQNATIINGLKMLQLQADKAWEIWNS